MSRQHRRLKVWSSLVLTTLGGIQMGLYLADRIDDGVADSLSAWIGVVIVAAGFSVGLWPSRVRE